MKYLVLVLLMNLAIFANDVGDNQVTDRETKQSMDNWLSGIFGLQAYKSNYLLPYGYATKVYKSYTPTDRYMNAEAELQVSLKYNIANDLLGLNEAYFLSYTHNAFWQVYSDSSPFRETNYNPEGFVVVPVSDTYTFLHIQSLKLALAHKSNGQGSNKDVVYSNPADNLGNRSRSFNYVYSTLRLKHGALLTDYTYMARLPEKADTDDNPDLMDYLGSSELRFSYFSGKHMYSLMGRENFSTGLGAVEGTYSYPLLNSTYFYAKAFNGYGESLIDYNKEVTKFSLGFSFSR
ncbi:MAG: phospholipase A [Campylobacterales bacterium]|nr:phospholipase A [Campylobacterales bacterium]